MNANTRKKRPRSGDLRKVVCRVCRSTLNLQSYKDHLTGKHPEEDNRDLRGHGQQALIFGGGAVRGRGRSDGGNLPETQSDHDEGVSDTSRVRVVDSNRLEDLEDDVEDVIRVTNEDMEVEEDVIPNT